MAGERRSRREVIRRRRQAGFVGRRGELAAFRDNLARGVEHDDYQFVFHVSGNAGVGKTALVRQWEKLAVERGAATVTVADEVHGPIEAMEAMARRLRELDHPLKDFEKRLALYRRLYQEVAASAETADHHAPGGTSMASGVLARTNSTPGAGGTGSTRCTRSRSTSSPRRRRGRSWPPGASPRRAGSGSSSAGASGCRCSSPCSPSASRTARRRWRTSRRRPWTSS
ncbi:MULTISPECIES: ATP-binding protein [Streptomyces]|uniref:ATP-binding protein n=1 Tax=Streptomyces TaxID=1883 RepID=UPI001D04EABD|nr:MULTISPECIES: ATP-binding protein [Streptomyces]